MKSFILVLVLGAVSKGWTATLVERIQILEKKILKYAEENTDIDNILSSLEQRSDAFDTRSLNVQRSLTVEHDGATGLNTKRAVGDAQVAFYAYLSSNRCITNDEMIMFDSIPSNVHSGYTYIDGIFTPGADGFYVFTWTIATANHQLKFATELIVNGQIKGSLTSDTDFEYQASKTGIHPATAFVVAHVTLGDHVAIRMKSHAANCRLILSDSQIKSSFAGWQLF